VERKSTKSDAQGRSSDEDRVETRTTGLQGQSKGHCKRCGKPVMGRRRNGYCSNGCRMRDRRAEQTIRVDKLITHIEEAAAALRQELDVRRHD